MAARGKRRRLSAVQNARSASSVLPTSNIHPGPPNTDNKRHTETGSDLISRLGIDLKAQLALPASPRLPYDAAVRYCHSSETSVRSRRAIILRSDGVVSLKMYFGQERRAVQRVWQNRGAPVDHRRTSRSLLVRRARSESQRCWPSTQWASVALDRI
jgi:hypothetical protein